MKIPISNYKVQFNIGIFILCISQQSITYRFIKSFKVKIHPLLEPIKKHYILLNNPIALPNITTSLSSIGLIFAF